VTEVHVGVVHCQARVQGVSAGIQVTQDGINTWQRVNINRACRVFNADIFMTEDYDVDDLVDTIEGSRIYVPAIYVVNKIDQVGCLGRLALLCRVEKKCCMPTPKKVHAVDVSYALVPKIAFILQLGIIAMEFVGKIPCFLSPPVMSTCACHIIMDTYTHGMDKFRSSPWLDRPFLVKLCQ